VVVNGRRHSLWPVRRPLPAGWREVFTAASREECLAHVERVWTDLTPARPRSTTAMQFGLMFFGGGEGALGQERYRLVLEGARFADQNGFASVWLPERHFAEMGCLYSSPAVLHAALAMQTKRVRLRAGSVVLPLHHPVRVVEEWAIVDNLSGGRVDLSFAAGWNVTDFVLNPDRYAQRYDDLAASLSQVERLWQGQTIQARDGEGREVAVRVYPTTIQPRLTYWLTAAGSLRTFEKAGSLGANLLTHLFDQDLEDLAGKITAYRAAREKHGHDPAAGWVTVALHTFLAGSLDEVRRHARGPYCDYLKANVGMLQSLARSRGMNLDLATLTPAQLDELVPLVFEKFLHGRSLLGTPESCARVVGELAAVGVNEVACLIDFGPSPEVVLEHLPYLGKLCRQFTDV
jgi:natural product biosynthesis luciferase-like monooxygenase protein